MRQQTRAAAIVLVALLALLVAALVVGRSSPSAVPSPSPIAAESPSTLPTAVPSPPVTVIPVPPSPISLPTYVGLSAPSRTVVWALVAGTRLFESSDRGDTRVERPLPPGLPLPDASFVSDREGWVTVQRQSQALSCPALQLIHTADAGGTWQEVSFSGLQGDQCHALSFIDAQRGFLSASVLSQATVFVTSDSGRTWRGSAMPDPPGFSRAGGGSINLGRVRAFGAQLLVEIAAVSGNVPVRRVAGSTDGGATWTYLAAAPDPGVSIAFVTATRWLQISNAQGESKETTDAGRSWHAYASDYGNAAPITSEFVFGDAQVGYATVRGGIQRTIDGGLHWTGLKTPGT
jgi:photosystem II stability/assembly factor-like uncharacterized protein